MHLAWISLLYVSQIKHENALYSFKDVTSDVQRKMQGYLVGKKVHSGSVSALSTIYMWANYCSQDTFSGHCTVLDSCFISSPQTTATHQLCPLDFFWMWGYFQSEHRFTVS